MNRTHRITPLVLSAAIGAAALGATSAHACDDPLQAKPGPHAMITLPAREATTVQTGIAARDIVGMWLVNGYDSNGVYQGQTYVQWHSDGTEFENTSAPISDPMCLGAWKAVDRQHVSRNHFGWIVNNGVLIGYFNEVETETVGRDGTYTGVNEAWAYDLQGNLIGHGTGSTTAVKIAP